MTDQYPGEMCEELQALLDIISGKWKPSILFHLINNEKLRFSELQKAMPGITKKMLTSQLRELEYDNIVHREVYPEIPPRVEYSLTEYGHEFKPLLVSMRSWGSKHLQYLKNWYENDEEKDALF
jgi:DNA-binding HxlR family transcriptional regulator